MKKTETRKKSTPPIVRKSRSTKVKAGDKSNPRRILVPIDFSRQSLKALDFATSLAHALNGDVTLIHALDPLHAPARYDSPKIRQLRAEALEDAKEKLKEIAEENDGAGHHVVGGIAHKSIVQFAKKMNADLIVMGSYGRSGVKRLLAGSTAENVVRHTQCPVLVVP